MYVHVHILAEVSRCASSDKICSINAHKLLVLPKSPSLYSPWGCTTLHCDVSGRLHLVACSLSADLWGGSQTVYSALYSPSRFLTMVIDRYSLFVAFVSFGPHKGLCIGWLLLPPVHRKNTLTLLNCYTTMLPILIILLTE